MPKCDKCCPKPYTPSADYVYAAVEGNILLDSGETRFVNSPPTNPASDPYNCVRGRLEGFDPVTGIFTAPRTALYSVSVWANYFQPGQSLPQIGGTTVTTVERFLVENICGGPGTGQPKGLDIAVVSQTAPWTSRPGEIGFDYFAGSSLGGDIPLRKGEQLIISVFQENDQSQRVSLFLEWMIVRGPKIDLGKPRGPGVGT